MPAREAITILGAGSWGTTLAWLLADKGLPVRLWGRDEPHLAEIRARRENARYLPGLRLPDTLTATASWHDALEGASLALVAVPTKAIRETLARLGSQAPPVLIAAKGLERETGKRVSQVAREELGPGARIAVLSGPNLSGEVVRRVPTATVIAATDKELALELQQTLGTPSFRVYTNRDLCGVELGGALKNPVAIAAGISDGLGYGENTKASLLTRGLGEITRLGTAAGARPETFSGLSGLGDLLATAHSALSRNYRFGLALGKGDTREHALAELHQVAEGVPTTDAACRLAESLGVEVPIFSTLREILYADKPLPEAVRDLLSRPYRDEGVQD
jgi:glycerol-3-phosphate dehydrogenase (NAD(P)+)